MGEVPEHLYNEMFHEVGRLKKEVESKEQLENIVQVAKRSVLQFNRMQNGR